MVSTETPFEVVHASNQPVSRCVGDEFNMS